MSCILVVDVEPTATMKPRIGGVGRGGLFFVQVT